MAPLSASKRSHQFQLPNNNAPQYEVSDDYVEDRNFAMEQLYGEYEEPASGKIKTNGKRFWGLHNSIFTHYNENNIKQFGFRITKFSPKDCLSNDIKLYSEHIPSKKPDGFKHVDAYRQHFRSSTILPIGKSQHSRSSGEHETVAINFFLK